MSMAAQQDFVLPAQGLQRAAKKRAVGIGQYLDFRHRPLELVNFGQQPVKALLRGRQAAASWLLRLRTVPGAAGAVPEKNRLEAFSWC